MKILISEQKSQLLFCIVNVWWLAGFMLYFAAKSLGFQPTSHQQILSRNRLLHFAGTASRTGCKQKRKRRHHCSPLCRTIASRHTEKYTAAYIWFSSICMDFDFVFCIFDIFCILIENMQNCIFHTRPPPWTRPPRGENGREICSLHISY